MRIICTTRKAKGPLKPDKELKERFKHTFDRLSLGAEKAIRPNMSAAEKKAIRDAAKQSEKMLLEELKLGVDRNEVCGEDLTPFKESEIIICPKCGARYERKDKPGIAQNAGPVTKTG